MITCPKGQKEEEDGGKNIEVNIIVLWFPVIKGYFISFLHFSSPNLDTLIW